MPRIHLSVPHLGDREAHYVSEAFRTNWVSTVGPNLVEFERAFAETQVLGQACVALSSGTAALHLALLGLGVSAGDEVVCSTLTFVACANAAVYLGATPVFIDSETKSWNMDPALLEECLAARAAAGKLPKAVVVVHLYGIAADLDPIVATCRKYGVALVEDAAEAVGTTYRGAPVGTFGEASIFSFNGNKIITTSGGGMLTARDPALVDRARYLSTQAREPGRAYHHIAVGYNYRMSNVLAGVGRGQLEVLEDRVAARCAIAARYKHALANVPGLTFMPDPGWGRATHWLSCMLVDEAAFGASSTHIIDELERRDIEARPVWKPMHMQPVFARAPVFGGAVSEDLFARGVCLPSSSSLPEADQARIIAGVLAVRDARRGGGGSHA